MSSNEGSYQHAVSAQGPFTSFPLSRRVRFAPRADIRPMPAFMSTRLETLTQRTPHNFASRTFGESLPSIARQALTPYRKHLCRAVGVTERDAQRDTPFGTHTERVMETRASPIRHVTPRPPYPLERS